MRSTLFVLFLAAVCAGPAAATAQSIDVVNFSAEINGGVPGTAVSDPSFIGWEGTGTIEPGAGSVDYGNGGWRFSFKGMEWVRHFTGHPVTTGEGYSLRFDAALFGGGGISGGTLIGPGVRNGDFNDDTSTTDSRNFADTPFWTNIGSSGQSQQATRLTLPPADGTRNAVLSDNGQKVFAVATGYTLVGGEEFTANYEWRDALNWEDAMDQVVVKIFSTSDDTVTGTATVIEAIAAPSSTVNSSYEPVTAGFAAIPMGQAGKKLFVSFEAVDGGGATTGFGRLDNFSFVLPGSVEPGTRTLTVEFVVDSTGTPQVVAGRTVDFTTPLVGAWDHYHLAVQPGDLDAHTGAILGVQFRSNDSGVENLQSVDNVRLEVWPGDAADGSFSNDWNTTPDQVWAGPGYWANRLQDWSVINHRLVCIAPDQNRRTVHRVGTTLRGDGQDFTLTVRTGLDAGTAIAGSKAGFLLGAGFNLHWKAALLVHSGLGRDFGLFLGVNGNGQAVIEDYSTGAVTGLAGGAVPAGGLGAEVGLTLSGVYNDVTGEYALTLQSRDAGGTLLSTAAYAVTSDRVLGGFGLLSHRGNNARFWFDDFAGTGLALADEPDRRLAILGAMHTVSRGTMRMTAQLSPVDRASTGPVTLETWDGQAWQNAGAAAIDPEAVSSYTATITVSPWDATADVPYRLGVTVQGATYYWEGTVRKDPVDRDELVVGLTSCQRISDISIQNNGFDWSPRQMWHPHAPLFQHLGRHQPDVLLALGDQIYEGQPTPEDSANDFDRQYDYLYKWNLWVLQVRDDAKDIPTVAIPDDHDVFQGNLWGENQADNIANQNDGGYEEPASWVRMVERTQTSNLPDADPYNPVQPAPPANPTNGITVYFTGLIYGGVGFAILEDRKFKTGKANPPPVAEQELLGDRQHAFLEAWAKDWAGQALKCVVSQSPLGLIKTHAAAGYNFSPNDRDTHGWPTTQRTEAWKRLRKSRMFQLAGDQHLASVAHHGVDGPADAGYSFTGPAVANFFPRIWDPGHQAGGPTSTVRPYKGDFFFDGNGTLPSGDPNYAVATDLLHPLRVIAAGNAKEYYHQTWDRDPVRLHDRAPGYGIVRIDKASRLITFEAWPYHVDPAFPQTGSQFADWPVTLHQADNDGRIPTGFLPVVETHWEKGSVVYVYDETTGELVYAMRTQGNAFRPPVYDNAMTYRLELGYGDDPVSEVFSGQVASVMGPAAIHRFSALQPSIVAGATATLQWDVESATTLTIDPGGNDVMPVTINGIGHLPVTPGVDTTYTLTLNGSMATTTTVRVFMNQAGWLAIHFTAAELTNSAISGDGADPDGDGRSNYVEYLFQTDPRVADALDFFGTVVEGNVSPLVEFDMPTPVLQGDCIARVETSTDVQSWTVLPSGSVTEVSRTAVGNTTRLGIRVKEAMTRSGQGEPRRVYRAVWDLP